MRFYLYHPFRWSTQFNYNETKVKHTERCRHRRRMAPNARRSETVMVDGKECAHTKKAFTYKKISRAEFATMRWGILGILLCIHILCSALRSVASDQPSHGSETATTPTTIIKKIKVQTDAIFIFFRFSFADELMIDATRVNIATLTPVRAHTYAPARHALTTIGA